MRTALSALLAVVFALLGVSWLPELARRSQGVVLCGVAMILAVYAFAQTQRSWPRPEPHSDDVTPDAFSLLTLKSLSRVQWIGLAVMALGLALTLWALLDIWREPFAWGQAKRWGLGVIVVVVGAYLLGRMTLFGRAFTSKRADAREIEIGLGQRPNRLSPRAYPPPPPASSPALVGPRPTGYKLRAMGLEEPPPEQPVLEGVASSGPPAVTLRQRVLKHYEPVIPHWLEVAALLLILLGGVWFRVYHIKEMPPGIFIDETNTALDGLRILEGRPDSLFGTGWFETPNGFVYLQTLFFRLLGTTFLAIKLQSLLPGIFTVVALYFLARELFGVRPALMSAAFLAFNRWHFNMSRWGWNEVYPPLMQVLTLWFIFRAVRRRHWGDWALAGLWLGLGMYTYLAIRLTVIAIAFYLGYRALVERSFLKRHWPGLLLFVLVYALTFAPLGFTYYKDPFTFLNRSKQVSILQDINPQEPVAKLVGASLRARSARITANIRKRFAALTGAEVFPAPLPPDPLEPFWLSLSRHVQMFHVQGDLNPRHNLPGKPMLDPISGAFFLLGAAWALWRWRDHRRGLLLIWMGVGLMGGVLSRLNEAPQAYRTLAVTPAIALLAGDAYDMSLRSLLHPAWRYHLWRWLWYGLAGAGLIVAASLNFHVYFKQQATDPAVYTAFSPLETTVAREVLAKRGDHKLYLSPRLYYFSPLRFLTYQPSRPIGLNLGPIHISPFSELGGGLEHPGYQLADPPQDLPLPDLDGASASFLLDLHFQYVMDLFQYYYPGATAQVVHDRLERPLYLSVTIPGDEITALQAINRADEAEHIRGLYIPSSGEYTLTSPATVLLDGKPLPQGQVFLGKGLHALTIQDLPPDLQGEAPVLMWTGAAGSGAVPDHYLFRKAPSGFGLLGVYYRGSDWAPPPFMQRIDPLLLNAWPDPEPVFGPFSVSWTGDLLVPSDGVYQFQINADDGVRFWVDGQVVAEGLVPDTVNQVAASLTLTAGPHPIRLDYFQRGGGKALEFFWQPPGQPLQPVASRYLRPARQ